MDILYLGNCGLLVTASDGKIMFDTPYGPGEGFSPLPDALWQDILHGTGLFGNIDALCFTHMHADHCDRQLLGEYLRVHRAQILLPQDGAVEEVTAGSLAVTAIRTHHSGAEYAGIPHASYLLSSGGKYVYVSGDADYNRDEQALALEGISVDAAFFNPYHLTSQHGRALLRRISPAQVYVYHAQPGDANGAMAHARRCQQREAANLPPCTFLPNAPGWHISLGDPF